MPLTQERVSPDNVSTDVILVNGVKQTDQLSVHSPGLQVVQDLGDS